MRSEADKVYGRFAGMVLCVVLWMGSAGAQTYPQVIRPGETRTVHTGNDTLWILNNRQFDRALAAKKKLDICDSMITIHEAKAQTLQQMIAAKDSTIADKDTLYQHYLETWKTCDADLEKAQIGQVRGRKRLKIFTVIGFVAGLVIGLVI
ncbi:MAG: hypothetical protein H6585_03185 [Flavobacteriales bacterium]|nr:hypothetical protein [Flavobacteriales bacterium]MCB9447332.1 hypothetical protein [Flavobacteriales bacterium]